MSQAKFKSEIVKDLKLKLLISMTVSNCQELEMQVCTLASKFHFLASFEPVFTPGLAKSTVVIQLLNPSFLTKLAN